MPVSIFLRSRSVRLGALIAVISVAGFVLYSYVFNVDVCDSTAWLRDFARANMVETHLILFTWIFFLFLTVMPLGSVTALIFGALLGPLAGVTQFVSQTLSSAVLYEFGRERETEESQREVERFPALVKLQQTSRRRGLALSVFLRLMPVVPSAVASLTSSYLGINRFQFYGGTIIAGWVRPVAFAALASIAVNSALGETGSSFLQNFTVCHAPS